MITKFCERGIDPEGAWNRIHRIFLNWNFFGSCKACLIFALFVSPTVRSSFSQILHLGLFDGHGDVGTPALRGHATYNEVSQEYSMSAAGSNMWAERDEFHVIWKKMSGDFVLRARVELLGEGVDPHRKLGWIIRTNLEDDSPYADAAVHGDGLTSLQYRRAKGAITEQVQSTLKGPDVIQFSKKGNSYEFAAARFGEPLQSVRLDHLDLGEELYVGLFLCSHNPEDVERAVFRHVRIIRPAKDDFRPYRDYIGSNLEILDVESGRRQMVYRSAKPFEAPNWTADGAGLQYNNSGSDPNHRGRLVYFDLATRHPTVIDTGSNVRLNNDHVLSFDGAMVGISDQSQGQSAVFTLPATGGKPKRITPNSPSYLHGWSPDGKWLVYTGGRNSEYDIYKVASDGSGEEINLTKSPGLDDGPEFSPDGKYIYFNSVRSGSMQIWRMTADGREPVQITDDGFHNWFPHVSPDGKEIAMISFSKEIDANDHPYYKHVTLRLLRIEGGVPRVIAYVYGGQGTMNVPSWSPDGRMLSFVSNTAFE